MDDVENIYFNATVAGPSAVGDVDGNTAIYDVTRAAPIISRPSDYYVSVVRLSLNLNSCPIFICPIATPPSTTPWVVGISYGGNYYEQALIWQTELYAPVNPLVDWTYFCFNIQVFASMVNVAMAAAFAAFSAANPGAPQAAVGKPAPYVVYNPATQLFSWVWDSSWATAAPATGTLAPGEARVGLNNALLAVFDGFRVLLVGSPQPNNDANYVWETLPATSLGGGLYSTSQSFNCITLLSTLRRIVVTTASIPIVPENVPASAPNGAADYNSGAVAYRPVLADFVPQIALSGDVRSTVYYTPRGQYRLVNMQSDSPLNRIQLSFWWVSTDGILYPIVLARNAIAEVKLGFFRKSLYDKGGVTRAITHQTRVIEETGF